MPPNFRLHILYDLGDLNFCCALISERQELKQLAATALLLRALLGQKIRDIGGEMKKENARKWLELVLRSVQL